MNVEHIYEDFDWPINLFSSVCVFLITGSLNEINGKIKWLTNKKKRAFCPLFLFNLKFNDFSKSCFDKSFSLLIFSIPVPPTLKTLFGGCIMCTRDESMFGELIDRYNQNFVYIAVVIMLYRLFL